MGGIISRCLSGHAGGVEDTLMKGAPPIVDNEALGDAIDQGCVGADGLVYLLDSIEMKYGLTRLDSNNSIL